MENGERGFDSFGVDVQRNIFLRLPAVSYASASCVSRFWNHLCNQFLSTPKLLSALSLNPSLLAAVDETLDKVLSEPIRPDFAILCIRLGCNCYVKKECNKLVKKRLGPRIPIIISDCFGAIGSEVRTNEVREVMWKEEKPCEPFRQFRFGCSSEMINYGVLLIVGFMPGVKVSAIPLLQPSKEPPEDCILEKFVADIKDYTTCVSGSSSPAGIMMFTDEFSDMKSLILEKMDFSLSAETVIVGGEAGCFLYSSGDDDTFLGACQHFQEVHNCKCAAVALVFSTDKDKSHGEIKFNLAISNGLTSLHPIYEAAEVRVTRNVRFECSTRLTLREKGSVEKLDGFEILREIHKEMEEEGDFDCGLYIGVTKRQHCALGSKNFKFLPTLAYDEVEGASDGYLIVEGDRIKTGDPFCFYLPDGMTASFSSDNVVRDLKILKQKAKGSADGSKKEEVFGGLLFTSYRRRECFFKQQNVDSPFLCRSDKDSLAFLENFPGVPFAGMFCSGEIGRGNLISSPIEEDDDYGDEDDIEAYNYYDSRTCLQVYSAVYLVLSYTPKPLEY